MTSSSKDTANLLSAGTIIAHRYEILDVLGKGASGVVYLCKHHNSPQLFAIKILPLKHTLQPLALTRFDAEVELSSRVIHPNVVRTMNTIINYDMLGYTMEYVSGGSLASLLKTRGRLSVLETVSLLEQICRGLAAIHKAGILHHDMKPANVLLSREFIPKISDFGISSNNEFDEKLKNDRLYGTASYISPERIRSGEADKRSDIFSVGVMAYEMLTGVLPFGSGAGVGAMARRFNTTPPPAHVIAPECPIFLAKVIQKALSVKPEDRFQSAEHMIVALEMLKAEASIQMLRTPPRAPAPFCLVPSKKTRVVNKTDIENWH